MRPKLRKVNTKKRKKKRAEAQQQLQKQAAAFLKHPTECCMCKAKFERTPDTVKTWQVVVNDDRVRLTCPTCWAHLLEALEDNNG